MTRRASPAELLKNPKFRGYWLASLSANFGWQIQIVAASWLMVSVGGTPELVALVQTSVALPAMLLSLPGGALSDVIGQRKLVIRTQLFLLAVSLALAAGAFLGWLSPLVLLACTFLIGAGRAIYYPGWQSMVFEFVSRNDAPVAVALGTSNINVARSLGPAVGGAIVALAGAFVAFLVSALSNLSVILAARRWPSDGPSQGLPPEPFSSAIMGGIRYVALSPNLLAILFRAAVFNIGAISVLALAPLIARDLLGGGPQTYGLLLGAFGVGAIVGSLATDTVRRRVALERFLALGHLGFALALTVLALSHSLPLSVAAAGIGGVSWIFVQVVLAASVQVSSPRWVMSRTIAIYQVAVFGGNTVGSIAWGIMAGSYGTRVSLGASAAMIGAAILLVFLFGIRELDTSVVDPNSEWVAPVPKVDMVLKSGPIMTTVQYRIREEDVPAFLEAMREKRRNRIRDGAVRWTLSRDIQDPSLWFERFKVATWAEAQRLHSRRTVAGAEANLAARRLHQGPGLPEVHYELVRHPSATSGRPGADTHHIEH